MNDTIRLMEAHRSVRRFEQSPVPDDHVRAAVAAGQMASTSSAVQAYAVIHVRHAEKLERLAELAGPQEKIKRCGAFLVVCADARRHRLQCERAGEAYAETFENFVVGVIDAALFAQNMVLAFESMGYGICYIGGVRNDLAQVRDIVAAPEGVFPLFGMCVGLAAESPGVRPRLPVDAVLFDDVYPDDATLLDGIDRYDERYRDYLAQRGAAPKSWSEAMADKHKAPARPGVGAFYASQGAHLG